MVKTFAVMGGAALAAALAFPLSSRANLLTNGDLEVTPAHLATDPTMLYSDNLIHASSAIHPNALVGWTIGGACIDVVPNSYWQAATGSYSVDLIGSSGIGSISQTVTGLTPGTPYELTFDFSINPENFTGEAGSTKIMQFLVTNSDQPSTIYTGTAGTRTDGNMQWALQTLDFTPSASSVNITFAALMPTNVPAVLLVTNQPARPDTVCCGPVIDSLDLELASGVTRTPEPATMGILGTSGLLLLRRRRPARN